MAGILDNPDAAYAKLKEMGKGLFGNSGGLGGILGGLGGNGSAGSGSGGTSGGANDNIGSRLGETLGNLLQQGLAPRRGQNRNSGDTTVARGIGCAARAGGERADAGCAAGLRGDERGAEAVV